MINVHRMLKVLINFHTNCIEQIKKFTFAENNIEKNVKESVLFKNYKERFECSLHLWLRLLYTLIKKYSDLEA